jgi:hypothetical protein
VDQNSSCVSYLWNGIPQLTRYVGFGLTDTPKCLCEGGGGGGGGGTTNHLIFHCKILRNQRNEMIKQKTLVAIGLRRMKR